MRAVFLGEKTAASNGSGLTGVSYNVNVVGNDCDNNNNNNNNSSSSSSRSNGQLCTPPDEPGHFAALTRTWSGASGASAASSASSMPVAADGAGAGCGFGPYAVPAAWLELWDFAGCASFRGFVAEDVAGERSLFAFFDAMLLSRDLKQALMAVIELADSALGCAQLVVCVDRAAQPEEVASLMKGLQWAGFSLTTLDSWTGGEGVDVTSPSWIFMGMEL